MKQGVHQDGALRREVRKGEGQSVFPPAALGPAGGMSAFEGGMPAHLSARQTGLGQLTSSGEVSLQLQKPGLAPLSQGQGKRAEMREGVRWF